VVIVGVVVVLLVEEILLRIIIEFVDITVLVDVPDLVRFSFGVFAVFGGVVDRHVDGVLRHRLYLVTSFLRSGRSAECYCRDYGASGQGGSDATCGAAGCFPHHRGSFRVGVNH